MSARIGKERGFGKNACDSRGVKSVHKACTTRAPPKRAFGGLGKG